VTPSFLVKFLGTEREVKPLKFKDLPSNNLKTTVNYNPREALNCFCLRTWFGVALSTMTSELLEENAYVKSAMKKGVLSSG